MSEDTEGKRISKLTSLIGQSQDNLDGLQIYVHYSENNWETSEEINLILNKNTTISQLIETSINKFKTELFYDNIDKKKFNVRVFKKKKKIPNMEYPVCNPGSKIGDYGKTHFCLVEEEEENKRNDTNEEIVLEKKGEVNNIINDSNQNKQKETKNDINQNNISSETKETNEKEQKTENTSSNNKNNKTSCRPCLIF